MEDSDDEVPVELDLADLAARRGPAGSAAGAAWCTSTPRRPWSLGRPRLLLRALDNLLDNAAKFDSGGLPIEVTVRPGTVIVRDHGPGVAPADQRRVFDRFYRALPARSQPGSGLGLAIVRDAVAAHDGQVTVANHPAAGRFSRSPCRLLGLATTRPTFPAPPLFPEDPQEALGQVLRRRSRPLTRARQLLERRQTGRTIMPVQPSEPPSRKPTREAFPLPRAGARRRHGPDQDRHPVDRRRQSRRRRGLRGAGGGVHAPRVGQARPRR